MEAVQSFSPVVCCMLNLLRPPASARARAFHLHPLSTMPEFVGGHLLRQIPSSRTSYQLLHQPLSKTSVLHTRPSVDLLFGFHISTISKKWAIQSLPSSFFLVSLSSLVGVCSLFLAFLSSHIGAGHSSASLDTLDYTLAPLHRVGLSTIPSAPL